MNDHRALGRTMHAAFNARDFAAAAELFAPGFISHPLGTIGRESIQRAWVAIAERYPELRSEIEHILVDGDTVAIHARLHGAAEPAQMVEIFRVEDGRIAELWGLSDLVR
jgi:predicted SnoaL-like aldol condensation-catalyzing enzyme